MYQMNTGCIRGNILLDHDLIDDGMRHLYNQKVISFKHSRNPDMNNKRDDDRIATLILLDSPHTYTPHWRQKSAINLGLLLRRQSAPQQDRFIIHSFVTV